MHVWFMYVIMILSRLEAEDTAFDGNRYLGDYVEAEVTVMQRSK
jgi:hypothetical protein